MLILIMKIKLLCVSGRNFLQCHFLLLEGSILYSVKMMGLPEILVML
jgi:hypothetical protein